MITLDADLYLITSRLNISPKRLSEYADKSLEEIIEAEAAQGNMQAAQLGSQILTDPVELQKIFKLADPNNRYAILRNLSEHDLNSLLPLLTPEDLVMGLNFFTKDKLLTLLGSIPKNQLVRYVSQMFTPEQIMQLMPEKNIDKVLQSQDLDKGLVLKHLKSLRPEILAQMIEAATGKPVKSMDPQELIKQIASLSPDKYKNALISIPPQNKRFFVLQMIKEEPKVLQLFDADAYVKILGQKEKPDLIRSAGVIPPDQLIKMMGALPQDLLAIVVTQIDPGKFADMLIKDYKDILSELIAA